MHKFLIRNRWVIFTFALILAATFHYIPAINPLKVPRMGQIRFDWYEGIREKGFLVSLVFLLFPIIYQAPKKEKVVVKIGGIGLSLKDLYTSMCITGATGSGKTAGAIKSIARQFFLNIPDWGGLCLDIKGVFADEIEDMARGVGPEAVKKMNRIQVCPDSICCRLGLNTEEFEARILFSKIKDAIEKDCSYKLSESSVNLVNGDMLEANELVTLHMDGDEYIVMVNATYFDVPNLRKFKIEGDLLQNLTKNIHYLPSKEWKPKNVYNILSNPAIPPLSYAKMLLDTGKALSGSKSKGGGSGDYFEQQAGQQVAHMLELLRLVQWMRHQVKGIDVWAKKLQSKGKLAQSTSKLSPREIWKQMPNFVSIKNLADLLLDDWLLSDENNIIDFLKKYVVDSPTSPLKAHQEKHKELSKIVNHFVRFKEKSKNAKSEMSGITGTLENLLQFFRDPYLAEIFSQEENTIEFDMIDEGYIFAIQIPNRYKKEKPFINSFFKAMYYTHIGERFDRRESLGNKNLLYLFFDEAQSGVTEGGGELSEANVLDKSRQSRAGALLATQSVSSYNIPLSAEYKEAMLLNMSTHIHFRASDEEAAQYIATSFGKEEKWIETGKNTSDGKTSVSKSLTEVHKIKAYELREFKDFECVIISPRSRPKRTFIPPLSPEGRVLSFYHNLV